LYVERDKGGEKGEEIVERCCMWRQIKEGREERR
jgi:hypothetical protein